MENIPKMFISLIWFSDMQYILKSCMYQSLSFMNSLFVFFDGWCIERLSPSKVVPTDERFLLLITNSRQPFPPSFHICKTRLHFNVVWESNNNNNNNSFRFSQTSIWPYYTKYNYNIKIKIDNIIRKRKLNKNNLICSN